MKYIRTKDGRIIELPKTPTLMKYDNTIIDLSAVRKGKVGYEIINALIDKQADTIEELCDEFVMETIINGKLFRTLFREHKSSKSSKYDMFKESWKIYNGYPQEIKDKKIHNYYGAIWTDKGLIYVAKMNDKGELELL